MILFPVTDSVYRSRIAVLYGTRDEYTRYSKRRFNVDDPPHKSQNGEFARFIVAGEPKYVMWIDSEQKRPIDILDTIAHECTHATGVILRHHEVKWSTNNDEPYAYFHASITRQIAARILWLRKRS